MRRLKPFQSGEVSFGLTLVIVVILLAVLVMPIWLKKSNDDKSAKARAAEEAIALGTAPSASAATAETSGAPRSIGFGLTFALAPPGNNQATAVVSFSCHGEPRQLDQPHKGSCNPYAGDTSCRIVLPVLCIKPTGEPVPAGVVDGFYQGWTGGILGATQPVMGAILDSAQVATARCESELGKGWRLAEFHDGNGGWGLQGLRGQGVRADTRYWVHVNDQRGNCWDSTP